MHRRTQERGNMHQAVDVLKQYYREIEDDFKSFLPDLVDFSKKRLDELQKANNY